MSLVENKWITFENKCIMDKKSLVENCKKCKKIKIKTHALNVQNITCKVSKTHLC